MSRASLDCSLHFLMLNLRSHCSMLLDTALAIWLLDEREVDRYRPLLSPSVSFSAHLRDVMLDLS